jgi:hypothetical protein
VSPPILRRSDVAADIGCVAGVEFRACYETADRHSAVPIADEKPTLYEQVTDVNVFSLSGSLLLLLSLLSTGFVFAL